VYVQVLVHPKITILSLITHPHIIPNAQDLRLCMNGCTFIYIKT